MKPKTWTFSLLIALSEPMSIRSNKPILLRSRVLVIILIGMLLLMCRPSFACLVMPKNLVRPYAEVVDEANQIFLAEVVSSQPISRVGRAAKAHEPVRYTLKIILVFKGKMGKTVQLDGEGDLSSIWDTTFSDHAGDWFGENADGRMGAYMDCSLAAPAFLIGKRYLILLSELEDSKQFERIDTSNDHWLQYVAKRTDPAFPKERLQVFDEMLPWKIYGFKLKDISLSDTDGCCHFKTLRGGVPRAYFYPLLLKPCIRKGPEGVNGHWVPTQSQINSLEKTLPAYLTSIGRDHLSVAIDQYDFYYVGIKIDQKAIIYVDASKKISLGMRPGQKQRPLAENWQPKMGMNISCEAGDDAWGAEYDPKTSKFKNFAVNGG